MEAEHSPPINRLNVTILTNIPYGHTKPSTDMLPRVYEQMGSSSRSNAGI